LCFVYVYCFCVLCKCTVFGLCVSVRTSITETYAVKPANQ
jgi:hypothetical protein